jgi:alpha-1,3-glucosyltransferase
LRLLFISIWVARPRESRAFSPGPAQVSTCLHTDDTIGSLSVISLLAAERQAYFRTFILTSVAGIFSLFPLLFTPGGSTIIFPEFLMLTPGRIRDQGCIFCDMACSSIPASISQSLRVSLCLAFKPLFSSYCRFPKSMPYVILDTVEKVYLAGFIPLQLFVAAVPAWTAYKQRIAPSSCTNPDGSPCPTANGLEFLPLMATSVYCAVGMVWGFCRLMFVYLNEESTYTGQLSEIK